VEPGIDKDTFKQIFRDHWDTFTAANRSHYGTGYHDEVIQKMLGCGDPEKMGFAQYRCTHCGETHRVAFSCKSSFCLSCAKVHTEQWSDFIGRRMLPGVVYRHIVLTVPEFLRPWFYRNPGVLLSPFMRAGHACLLDVLKTCAKGVDLDIGTIIVLQTAGRPGIYNPHLHILLTEGGITPQNTWKSVSFIPFDLIHRKWQYHLLSMLKENIPDPRMKKDVNRAWKKYPKGFVAYVEKDKVPPGGGGLVKYLAKYVVSPPISVRRIQSYDGQKVQYWYRDHKTGQIEHSSPKASSASATTDSTATSATNSIAPGSPQYSPPKYPPVPKASASCPGSPSNNSSLKASDATRFSARGANAPWNSN